MKVKNLLIFSIIISSMQIAFGMGLERVALNAKILAKLKPIDNKDLIGRYGKPDIESLRQPNRNFVAKLDSFGWIRYFSLKNNKDAEELINNAHRGPGWEPEFFYYDGPTITN